MVNRIAILLVALLLVLQYQLWVGDGSLSEVVQLRAEIREQRAAIGELEERNRRLEAELQDLRDGLDAVEERARSELGMIREDEVFYQIVQEPRSGDLP
jgi:cell division protein FtsB